MDSKENLPVTLTDLERELLLRVLKLESADDSFVQFVDGFELALERYVLMRDLWAQRPAMEIGPNDRSAAHEIGRAATMLRGALNKAPNKTYQLLDAAYNVRQLTADLSNVTTKQTYTWSYTSAFSRDSSPFFKKLYESLDMVVKTAQMAATPSEKQYKGGRPPNVPLADLARNIATELDNTLNIRPTMTSTGKFTEVLQLALQLVDDGAKPLSISRFVRQAVRDIPKPNSRSS